MESRDFTQFKATKGFLEPTIATKVSPNATYIFLSGVLGFNPENNTLPESINDQAAQTFKNIDNILRLSGSSFQSVIKIIVFITDMAYLDVVNKEYEKWISKDNIPVRTTLAVKGLPRGAKVEAEVIAVEEQDAIKTIPHNEVTKPIGPFVTAKRVSSNCSFVYLAGVIGTDPRSNALPEGITEQTKQAMKNIQALLGRANSSLSNVIKTTIYLSDMKDFQGLNEEYGKWFNKGEYPTRTCIAVKQLPKDAKVEIDIIAVEEPYTKYQNVVGDDVPKPLAPYSVGKRIRPNTPLLFMSGVIGQDEQGRLPESVGEQTRNALKAIASSFTATKGGFDKVVKATVLLTDMKDFAEMNEEYGKWFPKGKEPARLCVATTELPRKAKVQIELVLADPSSPQAKL